MGNKYDPNACEELLKDLSKSLTTPLMKRVKAMLETCRSTIEQMVEESDRDWQTLSELRADRAAWAKGHANMRAERDKAWEKNDELENQLEVYRSSAAPGKEAEELRKGIEDILARIPGNDYENEEQLRGALIRLLDEVDARDSLAYLERSDASSSSEAKVAP